MVFSNHDKKENISSLDLNELKEINIFIATSVLNILTLLRLAILISVLCLSVVKKEIIKIYKELKSSSISNEYL